jgi:hypothetical protein
MSGMVFFILKELNDKPIKPEQMSKKILVEKKHLVELLRLSDKAASSLISHNERLVLRKQMEDLSSVIRECKGVEDVENEKLQKSLVLMNLLLKKDYPDFGLMNEIIKFYNEHYVGILDLYENPGKNSPLKKFQDWYANKGHAEQSLFQEAILYIEMALGGHLMPHEYNKIRAFIDLYKIKKKASYTMAELKEKIGEDFDLIPE